MMEYVKMTAAHVPQIAEIEKLCFSDPWPEAAITPELTNPLSLWLVALDAGRVAGYVGSQTVLGEADIMNIAVHPDYRRQGVGQALVTRLTDALAQQESHALMLEVRVSNTAALNMYDKLGFTQVGRRPNYYFHPREDALILRKEWSL